MTLFGLAKLPLGTSRRQRLDDLKSPGIGRVLGKGSKQT
jgi:hypothetical protein